MAIILINKSFSSTKKGPGRVHSNGHMKDSPVKAKGAGPGFVLHEADGAKKDRRAKVQALGRRKATETMKREHRAALLPKVPA